jgi:hypothetical protein
MRSELVAQISNLPYRRFSTCVAFLPDPRLADCKSAIQQNEILRYDAFGNRLQP